MTPPDDRSDDGGIRRYGRGTGNEGPSHRPRGADRARRAPRPRRPAGASGPAGATGSSEEGLPWKLIGAAGVAIVVILVVAVVIVGGGGGSGSGGACIEDLAHHLPKKGSERLILATDLGEARGKGFEDGSTLEALGDSRRRTGAWPGRLTLDLRFSQLYSAREFASRTGIEAGSLSCTIDAPRVELASGSFDAAKVQGSDIADRGRLVGADDVIAYGSGDGLGQRLTPLDRDSLGDDADFTKVLDRLRSDGAYSVAIELSTASGGTGPTAGGTGLATGDGDARTVVVAYQYRNDDDAADGRSALAGQLRAVFGDALDVNVSDLQVEEAQVVGTFALQEPERWLQSVASGTRLLP